MTRTKKTIIDKVLGLFLKFDKVSLTKLRYATKEASNNYYYTRCIFTLRNRGYKIVLDKKGFYILKNKKGKK